MLVDIFMYIICALAVGLVIFLLIKKVDINISLLTTGIVLIIFAMILGRINIEKPIDAFMPISVIIDQFKKTLSGPGFIILILGGYTAYMTKIQANDVVVNSLTKPLLKIKAKSLLIPMVFIIGNILSLGVPSASNLAIILMATLFPVLKKSGMSTLTAAGIIATTATIMPTPLGSDNVAIAEQLGMSVSEYTFKFHAVVSLPTIVVMTLTHFFWQTYMDKRDIKLGRVAQAVESDFKEIDEVKGGWFFKTVYTILPLLPILILIVLFVTNIFLPTDSKFEMSVEMVSLVSFIFAIFCQFVRTKSIKQPIAETNDFWKGMGASMGVVVLLVSANVFVAGIQLIGLTDALQNAMETSKPPGFTLPLVIVLLSALIVILSGSGTSLVFAMIPLVPSLALAAGIPAPAITVPLGLSGNLFRSMSPVSAVVIIISSKTGVLPFDIVKRTSVPILVGVVTMFALSMGLFLTGLVG